MALSDAAAEQFDADALMQRSWQEPVIVLAIGCTFKCKIVYVPILAILCLWFVAMLREACPGYLILI